MVYSNKMVSIDKELSDDILYIYGRENVPSKQVYYDELAAGQMQEHQLYSLLRKLLEHFDDIIQRDLSFPYLEYDFDTDLAYKLMDLGKEYKKIRDNLDIKKDFNVEEYSEILKVLKSYTEVNYTLHILRDLNKASISYLDDLKYYKSEEEIKKWKEEYDIAVKNKDIEKAKKLLLQVQEEILEEWKKYMTDVDKITQDNFMFIGHSAKTTEFGDRYDYISCSLFTPEFTDTFNNRFGLIFRPVNIKGADWKDMNVNNYSESDDNLLFYSSVPIIHHPLRIVEELRKQRKRNEIDEDNRSVYSETVIEGFNPTAVFCFTTGAKNLDPDYIKALELQKNTGLEKMVVIDVFKLAKGYALDKLKHDLLSYMKYDYDKRLREKDPYYTYFSPNIEKKDVHRYEMFFEKFEELKTNGDYTEDDIREIFDHNYELLRIMDHELPRLSIEDRKYVLRKGFFFDFESIFNGTADPFMINRLRKSEEFSDIIEEVYPGFSSFVTLINRIPISEEMYAQMKAVNEELNFVTMSRFIANKILPVIEQEEKNMNDALLTKKMRKRELEIEKEKALETISKHDKYSSIKIHDYSLSIIEDDLSEIDLEEERSKKELEERNSEKEKKLTRKSELQDIINDKKAKARQKEEEKNSKLVEMKRRPVRNFFKIRKLKKEIELSKIKNLSESLYDSYERELSSLETDLTYIDFEIEYTEKKLEGLREERVRLGRMLNEYFGVDSIVAARKMLGEATEFESKYDYSIELHVYDIDREMEKIDHEIMESEAKLNELQSDKENVTKNL